MLYSYYSEKIRKAKKNEISDLVSFFMKALNGNEEFNIIRNQVLLDLTKKLYELKKNEYVEMVILDLEKLYELIFVFPEEKDFLVYIYLSSMVRNGKYEEIVKLFDFFKEHNSEKSEFYSLNSFNIATSLRILKKYEEAVNIIKDIDTVRCKLELAYIYCDMNNKKELEVYNDLSKKNLSSDDKLFICLRYSNYFLKHNDFKEAEKYVKKVIELMNCVGKEYRTVRYYEISLILKKLDKYTDSIYFLKLSANSKAYGEIDLEYRLKAIILCLELNLINHEYANSLIDSQDSFKESQLVEKYIKQIRGEKNEKNN